MQVNGTAINNTENLNTEAIIVLNDITRIRQLEKIRKDFVSNVSHELKTPITSIKGFVETLLEGAMYNHEEAKHFLEIISKHSSRLNDIIEDLLCLSRLEQDSEKNDAYFEEHEIKNILISAINVCDVNANIKKIKVDLECEDGLLAKVNPLLMEQAIVNLIDNALKYSEEKKSIKINAIRENQQIVIKIADEGYGISLEHIPRLFERFYRVDKARSRKAGGTGLGLAIVKHIIQVHKGRIEVASEISKGSIFTVYLPV